METGRQTTKTCWNQRRQEKNHYTNTSKMSSIQKPEEDTTPLIDGWIKQSEWHGNPELGYVSYMKKFPTPSGRKVPVYLFGKEGNGKNKPCRDLEGNISHYQDFPDWSYCVSAGADS